MITRMTILAGLTALAAGCEDMGMMGGGGATGATATGAAAAPASDPVLETNALPAPGTPDVGISAADDGALTAAD